MADAIADKKSLQEITLERLRTYVDQISSISSTLTPYIDDVFKKDKELYDVFVDSSIKEDDEDLIYSIYHPDAPKNEFYGKVIRSVNEKLLSTQRKSLIETRALEFNRNLELIRKIYVTEFPDSDKSFTEKVRARYLVQWNALEALLSRKDFITTWTAYPLFLKRYISLTNELLFLIQLKMDDEYDKLDELSKQRFDQDPKTAKTKESLKGSTLPFLPSGSRTSSSEHKDGDTSGFGSYEERREKINKARAEAINDGLLLMYGMDINAPVPDFETLFRSLNKLDLESMDKKEYEAVKAQLKQAYDMRAAIINSLRRRNGADERTITNEDVEFLVAKNLIEEETEKRGTSLTPAEIDKILSRSVRRLPEALLSELYIASQAVAKTRASSQNQESVATSSTPATLEKFFESDPRRLEYIETYATVTAYFESVPPQLLAQLTKEVALANPQFAITFPTYFEALRLRARKSLLKKSGKIPVFEDLNDFGNSKLSSEIRKAKAQLIEQMAELKTSVPKDETYHKLLTTPLEQTRKERDGIAQEIKKRKTISEVREEAVEILAEQRKQDELLQAQYIEAATIVALQEQFYENIALGRDAEQRQQKRQFFSLFGEQNVPLNADQNIAELLGAIELAGSGDAQELPQLDDSDRAQTQREAYSRVNQINSNSGRLQRTAQLARSILSNPLALAGIAGGAATGAGLVYAFTQGAATGAGALTSAAGGFAGGALIGTYIFPGVGTVVGGFIGAGVTTIGSLIPVGGSSVAHMIGTNVYGIGDGAKALEGIRSTATLGKEGLTAMSKLGPETVSAAAKSGANIFSGTQAAASKVGLNVLGGTNAFLGALPGTTASFPVATTIIGTITTVTATALIATSAMTGSFITPNDGQDIGSSRYVELTKIMEPSESSYPDNSVLTPSKSIKYTLKLTPKVDEKGQPYQITITNATDTVSISSKGHPVAPTIPPLDVFKSTATQEYTIKYDPSFADTRVSNVLTVTFDVKNSSGATQAQGETFSTSATVSFGNPPDDLACLVLDGSWSEIEKQKLTQAFAITAAYPTYRNILCDHGSVTLTRRSVGPDSRWYGQYLGNNTVALFDNTFSATSSILNIRFTLIHETGHVIEDNHASLVQDFTRGPFSEGYLRTYTFGGAGTVVEDFPESIAVYMTYMNRAYPGLGGQCMNMASAYPSHFAWEQVHMFPEDNGKPSGPTDGSTCAPQRY